uniref:SCP domain-containing protein n=1 Tax=Graphocephala atropunctata TaxID=36148 RepID=A0A1B6MU13_9HEMI
MGNCCKCQSESTQSLPRQSSNASIKSTPRTPQKTKDIDREEFAKQCLERHNEYRAKHKVQPLKLSAELSAFSQDWADQLAKTQTVDHRPNNKYGENLWWRSCRGSGCESFKVHGGDAVDDWYGEIVKYKFGTEPKNLDAGHLTQVLWATSEYLGVGLARSGDSTIVVCNYNPPGNYKGEFAEMVPPVGGWKDKPTPTKRPGMGFAAASETTELFAKETLRIHNEYRAKHGVPALSLDAEVSKFAQAWADHLAEKNQFVHRNNSPYGENIFWSSASASAKMMCDSWYGEEAGYNYDVDPFKSGAGLKSGHFTQMVWKQSKSLGVGRAFTKSGAMIAVANYSPRGNIIGQFTANVMPVGKRR